MARSRLRWSPPPGRPAPGRSWTRLSGSTAARRDRRPRPHRGGRAGSPAPPGARRPPARCPEVAPYWVAVRLTTRRAGDLDGCVALLARVHAADGYPVHWPEDPGRWLTPDELLGAWVAWRSGALAGHVCLCPAETGPS